MHDDCGLNREGKPGCAGIIGMGYVGFPLACAAIRGGVQVVGYDIDDAKIHSLNEGRSYLGPRAQDDFVELAHSSLFSATSSVEKLSQCKILVLCVPTPLKNDGTPDLTYVIDSTRLVASILSTGMLVILESTTWPGTTREVMMPILEETGLVCGKDFYLAYSPERENPADPVYDTASIPKVVGGIGQPATELACAFYQRIVKHVVSVTSTEVAEASKALENIYRCVNIALVNELKVAFEKMGIDVWEVIQASATKPFGFQPFWPGPGLGGHCIPIDPFYLSWRARQCGAETRFIELAGEINTAMPSIVVERVCDELKASSLSIEGAKILIVGVAYKPNVSDIRETPAAPIIEMLQSRGCELSYHDPHCPEFPAMRQHAIDLSSVPLDSDHVSNADAVLIVTHHDVIDWSVIGDHASLIIDTRNAMSDVPVAGRLVKA